MQKINVSGYAKINLYLDVLSKYENGYHEVNTVMQSLSLADTVSLEKIEKGIAISCDVPTVPCDEKNIAYRAASLFFEKSGVVGGVSIEIKKKIPVSAGLAGGSADAAATLIGLNELYKKPLDDMTLLSLGSLLGADVPFCMTGGTVFAEGKGDKLRALPQMPDCYIVVARSGEGVSTPWAYGELDRIYNNFVGIRQSNAQGLIDALGEGNLKGVCNNLKNVFESAVMPHRPAVEILKKEILDAGALASMMSGSGTAVFGIFNDREIAARCVEKLSSDGCFAVLTTQRKKKL